MSQSIHNPECTKYFISKAESIYGFGTVEQGMYMDSGINDTEAIEIFVDEDLYLARLGELGINPETEDEQLGG